MILKDIINDHKHYSLLMQNSDLLHTLEFNQVKSKAALKEQIERSEYGGVIISIAKSKTNSRQPSVITPDQHGEGANIRYWHNRKYHHSVCKTELFNSLPVGLYYLHLNTSRHSSTRSQIRTERSRLQSDNSELTYSTLTYNVINPIKASLKLNLKKRQAAMISELQRRLVSKDFRPSDGDILFGVEHMSLSRLAETVDDIHEILTKDPDMLFISDATNTIITSIASHYTNQRSRRYHKTDYPLVLKSTGTFWRSSLSFRLFQEIKDNFELDITKFVPIARMHIMNYCKNFNGKCAITSIFSEAEYTYKILKL